jgi:hypothetical protein
MNLSGDQERFVKMTSQALVEWRNSLFFGNPNPVGT